MRNTILMLTPSLETQLQGKIIYKLPVGYIGIGKKVHNYIFIYLTQFFLVS